MQFLIQPSTTLKIEKTMMIVEPRNVVSLEELKEVKDILLL
jgi:hypothetical protein